MRHRAFEVGDRPHDDRGPLIAARLAERGDLLRAARDGAERGECMLILAKKGEPELTAGEERFSAAGVVAERNEDLWRSYRDRAERIDGESEYTILDFDRQQQHARPELAHHLAKAIAEIGGLGRIAGSIHELPHEHHFWSHFK